MAKNKNDSSIANNTVEIWDFFQKHSGLDEKYYDKDIITDLRLALKLPQKGNIKDQLQRYSISTEDFLEAFFNTIKPFSQMMSDLLVMFEQAGGIETNKNLQISFDFDKNKTSLKFNIQKFRKVMEYTEEIIETYSKMNLSVNIFWRIYGVLREPSELYTEDSDRCIDNKEINKWMDIYFMHKWPDFVPEQPLSGVKSLDEKILKIWRIWRKVVLQGSSYDVDRDKLLNEIHGDTADSVKNKNSIISMQLLALIDSDHWAGEFIWLLCYRIEKLKSLPLNIQKQEQIRLEGALDILINDIYSDSYKVKVAKKRLRDFFNLPIWGKRYELYAAWISTQIVGALDHKDWCFLVKDNKIEFSFSGSHLANSNNLVPELQFWTELRTEYKKPRSVKRKSNIQPDYSLALSPVRLPDSSILVIECKQYKKASSRNFSDAIQDYAGGRPKASIILVNYGEASQNILNKVDISIHDRVFLIGNMKPGEVDSIELFKKLVRETIKNYYLKNGHKSAKSPWINLSLPAKITLEWNRIPKDLDLYLYIKTVENEKYKVCFDDKGSLEGMPMSSLKEDITNGYGPEEIEISMWHKGKYHVLVNNFSKESLLTQSGAKVMLSLNGEKIEIECPINGEGEWWDVFELDTTTGKIEKINRILQESELKEISFISRMQTVRDNILEERI